jgi:hypothetical protein
MTDDKPHSEEATEISRESDGRTVEIDTGFYRVQVWGDPDDSFDEVLTKAKAAADRAKADAVDLDDRIEDDGRHYR